MNEQNVPEDRKILPKYFIIRIGEIYKIRLYIICENIKYVFRNL